MSPMAHESRSILTNDVYTQGVYLETLNAGRIINDAAVRVKIKKDGLHIRHPINHDNTQNISKQSSLYVFPNRNVILIHEK